MYAICITLSDTWVCLGAACFCLTLHPKPALCGQLFRNINFKVNYIEYYIKYFKSNIFGSDACGSPARLAAMGRHQEVWRLPTPGEVVRPPEHRSRAGSDRRAVWPQAQTVCQSGHQQGCCKSGQGQGLQGGHDSQHWCAFCRLSSFKSVLLLIHIQPNWEKLK